MQIEGNPAAMSLDLSSGNYIVTDLGFSCISWKYFIVRY